jgi:hypothetical protein
VLDEFYRITFRKKLYRSIAEPQADLDQWLRQPTRDPLVLRQDAHADLP